MGYIGCILIQAVTIIFLMPVFTTPIILVHGFCLFAMSFVSDHEEQLRQLVEDIIAAQVKKFTFRQQMEMRKKLGEFIVFNGIARELSVLFS